MKVAVIGAGSTYTPELVSGLSRERDSLELDELVLHDIDAERRDVVGGLAGRMLERQGYGGKLEVTGELDRALEGADFVLVQIRVGGQAARLKDETIPLACSCIGQETTGAGGFAKAMRTVPVVLEIAARARALAAPGHWTLSVGLSHFRTVHQVQWNLTMAATLLFMALVIALFFAAQREFVEGVTLTGVKG